ncbi:MAG: hypothetical protein PG981_001203 [Wolbachia endosymbiont of Ctenocephalides orientis wCori]|nr:MAG: hypothetical protein PG981_001203 [Wolbachia endosymbiont of Ctenocephalides orientis wCori]
MYNFFSRERNITLLHLAAQEGNTTVIKNLIKRGIRFIKDINGRTPLHYAAIVGYKDAIEILIEELGYDRSEINRQDNEGNTPLHCTSNVDCVESLITNGARIIKNNGGYTQLRTFAIYGFNQCVEYMIYNLINRIRDLNLRDNQQCAFLHYAVRLCIGTDLIKYLYQKGLKVVDEGELIADKSGKSLLFYAAMSGNYKYFIDFYTFLITIPRFNSEFEIRRKGEEGATILHHIAQSDKEDLLKFIIEQGVEKRNPVHLSDGKVIRDLKGNLYYTMLLKVKRLIA